MYPTADKLVTFARTLEGETLFTLHRRRPFTVVVIGNDIEITPSTGSPRRTDPNHIDLLLNKLRSTGSFQPGQYTEVTFNASYILTLVKLWQDKTRKKDS